MVQEEIIAEFASLGEIFAAVGCNSSVNLSENQLEYFERFDVCAQTLNRHHAWFREDDVRSALEGISLWLNAATLHDFSSRYNFNAQPKKVALIMAGNIPLVGFHDFLCVILSGNSALCKPSSNDAPLWNLVLDFFKSRNSVIAKRTEISLGRLADFDAVIATGSNNAAVSFKHYFYSYPNLIRQSRTSVAVLQGDEKPDDLRRLGADIFSFFGFGCRNVTQIFMPKQMDIQLIFAELMPYAEVQNHHKYMNNYDYYRALYMMNGEKILENGFVIFRESDALHAPPAVVNYYFYEDLEKTSQFLLEKQEEIQAVVGYQGLPFGDAQKPKIDDFADGKDTMLFLSTLITQN